MRDTQDLEYTASLTADEVSNLLSEVRALRAERDRLRDGIAAHRDWVTAEGLAGTLPSKRLWSLLDGEADDE